MFQTLKKKSLSDWVGPKCKVNSYIDKTRLLLCSKPNLEFSLNYFSFLLEIFCISNYTFLQRMFFFFFFFYSRMNKPNMHNNIIGISSYQNGFNHPFSSPSFCIKSKIIRWKIICFLTLERFLSKFIALRMWHFFSPGGYPINPSFSST